MTSVRVGERDADGLALAAVDPVVAERAAVERSSTSSRRGTVRARAVAVGERGDDEVALGEAVHVDADLLHDADELVPDRAELVRRLAAVVPEVGAADAAEHDAHDGVGRRADGGSGRSPTVMSRGPLKIAARMVRRLLAAVR